MQEKERRGTSQMGGDSGDTTKRKVEFLDRIPEEKKDIRGKTGGLQIRHMSK